MGECVVSFVGPDEVKQVQRRQQHRKADWVKLRLLLVSGLHWMKSEMTTKSIPTLKPEWWQVAPSNLLEEH